MRLCPLIGAVLPLLDRTGARVARMSGSGATCFALYKDDLDLQIASDMVREEWGDWWQLAGHLR
jgi:4-diphosphocytidyl-2-C-methyl-D-erythritol kinase